MAPSVSSTCTRGCGPCWSHKAECQGSGNQVGQCLHCFHIFTDFILITETFLFILPSLLRREREICSSRTLWYVYFLIQCVPDSEPSHIILRQTMSMLVLGPTLRNPISLTPMSPLATSAHTLALKFPVSRYLNSRRRAWMNLLCLRLRGKS